MKAGRARGLSCTVTVMVAFAFTVGACMPTAGTKSQLANPTASPADVIALPTRLPDVISYEQILPLYQYDRSVPFDVYDGGVLPRGTATLHDITYMGANGVRMPAYLVVPSGQGPFAGAIWMGWSGSYSQIREEFVDEAADKAGKGVVSLLVAGYFPWYVSPRDKDSDRMAMIGQVRELRRAVDLVLAQAGVDSTRIAFVGHSMGAMHGANLAAVDHRVKAAVLMGPHGTMTDWIFEGYGLDPSTEPQYRKAMASFDPAAFVPHAAPSALFVQFGSDDPYVSHDVAQSLYDAASAPKKLGWYGGGHDLDGQARTERDAWLSQELALAD